MSSILGNQGSKADQEFNAQNNSSQQRPIIPVPQDLKYVMTAFKSDTGSEGRFRGELGFSQTKTVGESQTHMTTLLDQIDKTLASK